MSTHHARRPRLTSAVRGVVLASLLVGLAAIAGSASKPAGVGSAGRPTVSPSPPGPGTESGLCSASALVALGPTTGDLPPAVANRRAAIAEAAQACDIERLASYTGPQFMASFEEVPPATLWREAEGRGDEPLRFLVLILGIGHSVAVLDDGRQLYVWPAAVAHRSWSDVTEAERSALAGIYTNEELTRFEEVGRYVGYRVGIAEDGEWQFLVTGQR
jgi:hypothetical protein